MAGMHMDKKELKGLDSKEMEELVHELGEKPYRARQLMRWVYRRNERDIDGFTDLSKVFRNKLKEVSRLDSVRPVKKVSSSDGSVKYLFELGDGERIESVLVAHHKGPAICVSAQVGCRQGCAYCLSGKKGLRRNLTAGEIIDQVLFIRGELPEKTHWSVVLMGMGEPLDNYHNTVKAIRLMTDSAAMGISPGRITISTVGLAPELKSFAGEGLPVNVAVSLSAPDDRTRNGLIPANRRWGIKELLGACRAYPLRRRSKLTFEYVLIAGINDSEEQAIMLGKLLGGRNCLVNLIPFNPFPGSLYSPPPGETVLGFQKHLTDEGIKTLIRESCGRDIGAACGQLAFWGI
jgi:23S rRNA (adenine2503-C2)-methyltransferase